jgi:head-to-tail connecting protein
MADTKRQQLERRKGALTNERSSFIPHWKELSEFILPRQARFFVTDRNKGDRRSTKIHDNTATLAARTLSSGMMGGLTSPSRPWFQLLTPDPDLNEFQAVKEWLFLARDRMSQYFLSSNLYTTLPQTYAELGVFGTSAFSVLEDDEDVVRCYPFPIGSYSLATSHRGVVDTLYREYQMTAGQMVSEFGLKNCSAPVKRAYAAGRYDDPFDVVHAVEPNPEHDQKKLESKHKAWRSVYYEAGCKEEYFLSEKGFDSFPVMAPRWQVGAEDIYGTDCPGMVALGDIKALQLEQRRKMEAVAKMVNPPMVAPSSMKNAALSVLPGAINYQQETGAAAFTPAYQVQARLDHLVADIQESQHRIKEAFFVPLFQMFEQIDHGQMTAQEVGERQREKMLLLGPVLERLNDELFDPLIDRTFAIMLKRNLLPPPPPELHGVNLNVEYVSIMAQAAKLQGISGVQQLVQFGGNLAAANPEILDKYDFDATVDIFAGMLNTPPKMIRDNKAVQAIRAQRAQQQQMQQRLQMAQQAAETGKTMADTNVTDPNMLTQMLANVRGLNG